MTFEQALMGMLSSAPNLIGLVLLAWYLIGEIRLNREQIARLHAELIECWEKKAGG